MKFNADYLTVDIERANDEIVFIHTEYMPPDAKAYRISIRVNLNHIYTGATVFAKAWAKKYGVAYCDAAANEVKRYIKQAIRQGLGKGR